MDKKRQMRMVKQRYQVESDMAETPKECSDVAIKFESLKSQTEDGLELFFCTDCLEFHEPVDMFYSQCNSDVTDEMYNIGICILCAVDVANRKNLRNLISLG